jgi:hypothetical protein
MHATKERKKPLTDGFKVITTVKERGFHIQAIIMMAARSNREPDKRRKLRERDDRRMGGTNERARDCRLARRTTRVGRHQTTRIA